MGRGDQKALVLGGSGLVGYQVARKIAGQTDIREILMVARYSGETQDAVTSLLKEFPEKTVTGVFGDIFLPGKPSPSDQPDTSPPPEPDAAFRRRLFQDTYQDFETAYRDSMLVQLLLSEKPDLVIDCVNTATGISYQDVFTTCQAVRADLDAEDGDLQSLYEDVEKLMISLSIPQLILRTRLMNRALTEARVRLYLKVGTTGTGGMGLNIPYTHGEERPSPQLLNKTAIAFAQTGMLFLMARTPGSPIIKEIKPAALIGYRGVDFRAALGRQFKKKSDGKTASFELQERDEPYTLYRPRRIQLQDRLDLTPDPEGFETLVGPHGSSELRVALVDTGENGLFTRGEFEAITALDQMEYITPEEIANIVLLEARGVGTGRDVVSAIDSSVLGSTYKAGLLRPKALEMLTRLEEKHEVPSIALGRLGPPGLAKHLFEAYLFRRTYGTLGRVLALGQERDAAEKISQEFLKLVETEPLIASLSTSIGIPILCPDGETLLRGPVISAPTYRKFRHQVPISPESLEEYAQTWVDLRPQRMAWWLEIWKHMGESGRAADSSGWATARVTRSTYLSEDIEIGNVVAWIFSTQDQGFRVL